MLPGVDGFRWDAGHIIFLGAFFSVVVLVCMTLAFAFVRSFRDAKPHRQQAIRWHTEFSELPKEDRRCRHELTGEVARRQCPNEFDCRECAQHAKFVSLRPGTMAEIESQALVAGIPVPLDRFYHRGHTWARKEANGTWTVGLDEFARRLMGDTPKFKMPKTGDQVFTNGSLFEIRTADDSYRILSPVSGRVIASDGDTLTVQPDPGFKTDHLLSGCDVVAWLSKEFERLQVALSGNAQPLLADGGTMVENITAEYPDKDWDAVRARLLLNA